MMVVAPLGGTGLFTFYKRITTSHAHVTIHAVLHDFCGQKGPGYDHHQHGWQEVRHHSTSHVDGELRRWGMSRHVLAVRDASRAATACVPACAADVHHSSEFVGILARKRARTLDTPEHKRAPREGESKWRSKAAWTANKQSASKIDARLLGASARHACCCGTRRCPIQRYHGNTGGEMRGLRTRRSPGLNTRHQRFSIDARRRHVSGSGGAPRA